VNNEHFLGQSVIFFHVLLSEINLEDTNFKMNYIDEQFWLGAFWKKKWLWNSSTARNTLYCMVIWRTGVTLVIEGEGVSGAAWSAFSSCWNALVLFRTYL